MHLRWFLFLLTFVFSCDGERPNTPLSPGPTPPPTQQGMYGPQTGLPRARVVFLPEDKPEVVVRVEVASTPESRRIGLMSREKLGADEGMLFLFPEEDELSFWMDHTLLPLDMIFIKSDMTVLGVVEGAEPLTRTSRSVPGKSQFVVEVNATYARRHGIKPGTKVRFEGTQGILVE